MFCQLFQFIQCGLDVSIKEKFYDEFFDVVSKLGKKEIGMVAGD